MKKIGNIQTIELMFRPSVYVFDEIQHRLIFNRILDNADIQRAIGELGKEASQIAMIRNLANKVKTDMSERELMWANALVEDLSHIYVTIATYAEDVKNGSGKITYRNTTITFMKPRVVEFANV
mgnify:FL=1